ncbi:response regulator [bacterium]|nr:response regulator [bacterium]
MSAREILIVDDDPATREGIAELLSLRELTPLLAADGPEALKLLKQHPAIRVVLTDVRLPGMDGVKLLGQMRLAHPHLQVVLMTAFHDRAVAMRALRQGANDFLQKPIRAEDLLQAIERSLHRARLEVVSSHWREVLDQLKTGTLICDPMGIVKSVTPEAAELLRRSADSMVGKPVWNSTHLGNVRDLFEEEPAAHVGLLVAERHLHFERVPVNRELGIALLLVIDVTEQRRMKKDLAGFAQEVETRVAERTRFLSEEIHFTERLLDTADVLIAYINPEDKLERWNKFGQIVTGLSVEEAERRLAKYARDENSPLQPVFDPRCPDEISGRMAAIPAEDGTERVLTWSARRFREGPGMWGRLIIGIDVTEQKQLETTLQNYNAYLEDMVKQRSRELKTKNAQLIHTARLASLGEMVGSIAHEMKQPLNVIAITADLIKLLRKNGKLNDDLLESNLDKIRGTVDRMATTINHLRGFTHIDATTFKSLTVKQVVNGSLALIGEQIRLEDLEIETEVDGEIPPFRGEQNQIEQVLINLLQNARDAVLELKEQQGRALTLEQRTIIVRGKPHSEKNWIAVEVQDRGSGMPLEVAEHIFEPFFTTKDSSRGTGLGLAICLNIMRAHGGDVEVESAPGKGSVFRMLFPVDTEAVMLASQHTGKQSPAK